MSDVCLKSFCSITCKKNIKSYFINHNVENASLLDCKELNMKKKFQIFRKMTIYIKNRK